MDTEQRAQEAGESSTPLAQVVDIRSAASFGARSGGPRLQVCCPRCHAAAGRWCRPGGHELTAPVSGFLHVERSTPSL